MLLFLRQVVAGVLRLDSDYLNRQESNIEKALIHPCYAADNFFDIGVGKVENKFTLNDFVNVAKISENEAHNNEGTIPLISWICGNINRKCSSHRIVSDLTKCDLMCWQLDTLQNDLFVSIANEFKKNFLFCGVANSLLASFSKGQSGSGLISKINGENYLEAILIKRSPDKSLCNGKQVYGLLLRVHPMKTFIEAAMDFLEKENVRCDAAYVLHAN